MSRLYRRKSCLCNFQEQQYGVMPIQQLQVYTTIYHCDESSNLCKKQYSSIHVYKMINNFSETSSSGI